MTRNDRAPRRYMGSKARQLIVHAAMLDRVRVVLAGAMRTALLARAVTALTIPPGMRASPR